MSNRPRQVVDVAIKISESLRELERIKRSQQILAHSCFNLDGRG